MTNIEDMHRYEQCEGFDYRYNKLIPAGETVYIKMPTPSKNRRGINDIGWQSEDGILLYGTVNEEINNALWEQIIPGDNVNSTVFIIKAVNTEATDKRLIIRAILF